MRAHTCLVLGLLACGAAAAEAQEATIDLDVVDVPLDQLLTAVAEAGGEGLVVDPACALVPVEDLQLYEVPARHALGLLARRFDLRLRPLGEELRYAEPVPRVTLQFHDASTAECLRAIAAWSGNNLIVDPACGDGSLTLDLREAPWDDALSAGSAPLGWGMVDYGGGVLAVRPDARLGRGWRFGRRPRLAPRGPDTRVSLVVRDERISTACQLLSHQAGYPVRWGSERSGPRVTLNLIDVPWRDAALALAAVSGLHLRDTGAGLVFLPPGDAVLQARRASAQGLLQLLALQTGRPLELSSGLTRRLSMELRCYQATEAMVCVSDVLGYRLDERDGGWHVTGPALPAREDREEGWVLEATLASSALRGAAISGRAYPVGAALGEGWTLARVEPEQVWLCHTSGRQQELNLWED